MTKVHMKFELTRPLDDQIMDAISRATNIYGIHYVKLAPSLDQLTVEYDASRLKPEHVPATLNQSGIPVKIGG